jgi:uncharacterized protein DUF4397
VRSIACAIASSLMLLGAPAASALGAASVRFVNGAPGPGTVELRVQGARGTTPVKGAAAFGTVTSYVRAPSGRVQLEAAGGEAAAPLAERRVQLLERHRYTVVLAGPSRLGVYPDGRPRGRVARLRVIQAAPELGRADVWLDRRRIARRLRFERAGPYHDVEPGTYTLSATRPGGSGGALVSRRVVLTAGTSFTAVVAGSGGQRTRIALASDETITPGGAPATGLGGISRDREVPWLLVIAAALGAALLGGLLYSLLALRSRRSA